MIQAFISPMPVKARRVAIISGPGGPAVSSADACETNKLTLADLTKDSKMKLKEIIPEFGSSVSNPIDISLQATFDPKLEKKTYEIVGTDPNVDMIFIYLTMLTPRYRDLIELQQKISKPIVLVSAIDVNVSADCFSKEIKRSFIHIKAKEVPSIIKELNQNGISVHPNEDLASKALYNIYKYYNNPKKPISID